jgi:hypothetical protein
VVIPRPEHERLFRQALDFNGIDERCTVLFIVAARARRNRSRLRICPHRIRLISARRCWST